MCQKNGCDLKFRRLSANHRSLIRRLALMSPLIIISIIGHFSFLVFVKLTSIVLSLRFLYGHTTSQNFETKVSLQRSTHLGRCSPRRYQWTNINQYFFKPQCSMGQFVPYFAQLIFTCYFHRRVEVKDLQT